jgi:hypothetical protein
MLLNCFWLTCSAFADFVLSQRNAAQVSESNESNSISKGNSSQQKA